MVVRVPLSVKDVPGPASRVRGPEAIDTRPSRRPSRELAKIRDLLADLWMSAEMGTFGTRAAQAAVTLFEGDVAVIAMAEEGATQPTYRWSAGLPATVVLDACPPESLAIRAFTKGRTIRLDGRDAIREGLPELSTLRLGNAIAIPIEVHGRRYGVLVVGREANAKRPAREDLVTLDILVGQLAVAFSHFGIIQQARQSVLNINAIINSVPAILYEASFPDLDIRFMSASLTETLGYQPFEFITGNLRWIDCIHPEDRERVRKEIAAHAEGPGYQVRYRVLHQNGSDLRWVSDRGSFQRNPRGHPVAVMGSLSDITDTIEAEAVRIEALQKTQKALLDAMQAFALTTEKRDPYTAGHQARVAMIASAIARAMDLDEDCIEGIRIAGLIHDIGKIAIPAEILTRPGKLQDVEFDLIKTHAQQGYEIIRGIDFPWPVPEMVLQHHERMNGSGYPRGLRGDEIILEARILSVADMVEAITSHRPYRPGRGLDVALSELRKAQGTLYDDTVVEAFFGLIESGYKVPLG